MKNYSICSSMLAAAALSCIDTSATARQQPMMTMMSQRATTAFINKQSTQQTNQIENVLFNVRGGASKKKRGGGRTASLYSTNNNNRKKSSQKTATGKKKVQAAAKEAEKKSAVSDTLTKYKALFS